MANAYATRRSQGCQASLLLSGRRLDRRRLRLHAEPVTRGSSRGARVRRRVLDAAGRRTGQRLSSPATGSQREAAGKTGTSSENYSRLFDGFTPQLATAVDVQGRARSRRRTRWTTSLLGAITGGTIPVRIWTDYARRHRGHGEAEVSRPAYINRNAVPKRTSQPQRTSGRRAKAPHDRTTRPRGRPSRHGADADRHAAPTPTSTPAP